MRTGFLIPLALLIASAPCVARAADTVKSVDLPARFLLWDPASHRIYATVPGSGPNVGSRANTLTIINPDTGAIVSSAFVGAEPNRMALSASGRYLYIGVDGSNSVRVYDMTKQAMGPMISLGPSLTAADLAPVPGYPDSIAVERQNRNFSPSESGTMIFNADGSARKNVINGGHSLVYEPLTNRMYGFENEISSYGIRTMGADKDGTVELGYNEGVLVGNAHLTAGQNGLLFSDSANVIDPMNWTKLGQFPGYGYGSVLAVDSSTGRVYFADHNRSGVEIHAFDMHTFSQVASTVFPMPRGDAQRLIRWGEDGLAFTTETGQVWLVKSAVVGPKQSAVDLAVSAVGLPAEFTANAMTTCTITVTNAGATPATGVILSDQLSPNIEIVNVAASSGSATAANGVARLDAGDLAPHGKATLTVQLRLKPQDTSQEHPLTAVTQMVSARAQEPDSNPANNHLSQTAPLATSGPAAAVSGVDLTGAWKSLSQNSEGSGDDLQATVLGEFEVKNIGTETAGPTRLRFFLSGDRFYDPDFAKLIQEVGVPEIKPGGVYKVVLKARLHKGDDAIGLYVIAIVNATSTVAEANRKNNTVPSIAIP